MMRFGRGRMRRDEGGQLMLLSGIVITIAFIMTSLTLAQVSSLERQAVGESRNTLVEEWRFLHDRLIDNLNVAVNADLTNATFQDVTFPTVVATFRTIESEKGYDTVLRLAGDSTLVNRTESSLHDGVNYNAWDVQELYQYNDAFDGENDGIIWQRDCPDSEGPASGCIAGVLAYLHVSDGISTLEEVILVYVNRAAE